MELESGIKGPVLELLPQTSKAFNSENENSHHNILKIDNSATLKNFNCGLNLGASFGQVTEKTTNHRKIHGMAGLISKLYIVLNFIMRLKELSCVRKPKWLSEWHFSLIGDKSFFYYSHLKANKDKDENGMLSVFEKSKDRKVSLSSFHIFKQYITNSYFGKIIKSFKEYEIYDPSSKKMFLFDIIHLSFILYFFITVPIEISFDIHPYKYFGGSSFAYILFVFFPASFFVCDMTVKVKKGYYKRGKLVLDRKKILRHYFKKEFWYDFLSILFLLLKVFLLELEDHYSDYKSAIKIVSCLFFLKLRNFEKIFEEIEEYLFLDESWASTFALFKLLYRTILILHVFACLWIIIGEASQMEGESWLSDKKLVNENWKKRYLYSSYFIVITMNTVGYGDISPTNNSEILFTIFLVYFACGIFAYSINCIGNIINDITRRKSEFRRQVNVINGYMRKKGITFNLRKKVRKYLEFLWSEDNSQNQKEEEAIIRSLSDSLKKNLLLEANGTALKSLKAFTLNFSEEVLRRTAFCMKEQRYIPGDVLFSKGDVSDKAIFLVKKGEVEMVANYLGFHNSATTKLKVGKNGIFGEIAFFSNQERTFSAISSDFTTVFYIKRKEFLKILDDFPTDKERFFTISSMIDLYKDFTPLKMNCSSCKQNCHTLDECPWLHLPISKDSMIYRHLHSVPHERSTGKFRALKRFTIKKIRIIEGGAEAINNVIEESDVYDNADESGTNFNHDHSVSTIQNGRRKSRKSTNYIQMRRDSIPEEYEDREVNTDESDTEEIDENFRLNTMSSRKRSNFFREMDQFNVDKVYEFKDYFPKFNIKKVLHKYSRQAHKFRKLTKRLIISATEKTIATSLNSRKRITINPRHFEKNKKNFFHVPHRTRSMTVKTEKFIDKIIEKSKSLCNKAINAMKIIKRRTIMALRICLYGR